MKMAPEIRLVAANEIRQGVKGKVFRIGFAVMVLVVTAVAALPGILRSSGNKSAVVAVMGDVAQPVTAGSLRITFRAVVDRQEGVVLLKANKVKAVVAGNQLVVNRAGNTELRNALEQLHQSTVRNQRVAAAGLSPAQTQAVLAPVNRLQLTELKPDRTDPKAVGLASLAQILLFFALSTFGAAVLHGVLLEKSSRVVEVVLATVSTRQLLAGKLLGIGVLGLLQTTTLSIIGATVAKVVSGNQIPSTTGRTTIAFVACFLLGYAFYSALFAAAGSLSSRIEDAQAAATPVTLLLTVGYIAALFLAFSPDSTAARILMFVPPTAPSIAMVRIASGHPHWWELAISASLMIVATVGVLRLAARVYNGAALRTGARVKLRQALRT